MTRKFILPMTVVVVLVLCSCFSKPAQIADFGKTLTTEYGQANDGAEYVDIHGDMSHNSALIMPSIQFSAEQDTIHVEAVLTLVKKGKGALGFPWRIPLTQGINRITFGPKNELIWQRKVREKNTSFLTRAQILVPCREEGMEPDRFYTEVDLTGDGLKEIIISDSITAAGTGGIPWTIYRAAAPDQYFEAFRFGSGTHSLAVEDDIAPHSKGKRLWVYWHLSCAEGSIGYIFVNQKGEFETSPSLLIHPGDNGTESGNKIYSSVFSQEARLNINTLKKSGSDASHRQ